MGPDRFHPLFQKNVANEIALPLTLIFNKSLDTGTLPFDWKLANVTALFKKGNKGDPGNYRPVSLTCIVCKILESCIRDTIVNFLESKNLISDCQHGFRKGRS